MSQMLPERPPDEVFQVKVQNGGNSCYMDSVLYAMFATPSTSLDSLLTSRIPPSDPAARLKQDLQGVILKQFVSSIRHYEHITGEMVNNIRLQCRKMGWEYAGAPDQQQDAGEFFSFLYAALNGQLVRTMRRTFTGALPDSSDKGREENMALLPLALCDAQGAEPLQLGSLLDSFFYENVAAGLRRKVARPRIWLTANAMTAVSSSSGVCGGGQRCHAQQRDQTIGLTRMRSTLICHYPRRKLTDQTLRTLADGRVVGQEQEVYALNTYSVENVPSLVAVSLKRFDEQCLKIESQVEFPTHINLHKYSSRPEWRGNPIMHSVPWNLRSIVCHRGGSTQSGHYYAYSRYSPNDTPSAIWLRMDDAGSPCITQSNVYSDPYVKSEAVLFLYELDTDAHTAALMMIQEEEQGMLDDFNGFGAEAFGVGGYGSGGFGAVYQPAIPNALPPSFVSSVLAGMQAGRSGQVRARETGCGGHAVGDGGSGAGAKEDGKAAEREAESNQEEARGSNTGHVQAEGGEGGGKTVAGEGGSGVGREKEKEGGGTAVEGRSAGEALGMAVGGGGQAAGLPELMVALHGQMPSAPARKSRDGAKEVWESSVELAEEDGREPLLFVSALPTLDWAALAEEAVQVSVSKEGEGGEGDGGSSARLDSKRPSTIVKLSGGSGRYVVQLRVSRRSSA